MIRTLNRLLAPLAASALLLAAPLAQAAFTGYSSSAAFQAALAGQTIVIEGYEGQAADSTIANGGTLNSLSYSFSNGFDGRIDDFFANFGERSLGSAQPNSFNLPGYFFTVDSITVTFDDAVTAFGVFFNTDRVDADGVVSATTSNGESHGSGGAHDIDTFYFVGIVSDTAFTSVTFGATLNAASGFNVDNLMWVTADQALPAPGGIALLGLALLAAGVARRRS